VSSAEILGRQLERTLQKITAQMVPAPLWGISAAKLCSDWSLIRTYYIPSLNTRCFHCGRRAANCHEVWYYDDKNGIALLSEMRPICHKCHAVVHWGRTVTVGDAGEAFMHILSVNGWTREQANNMLAKAWSDWENRSFAHWKVLVSGRLLGLHPSLQILEGLER